VKTIKVGTHVCVKEPGQPSRRGKVTNIEALDDHFVADVACDDGTRLLAVPEWLLDKETP